MIENRVVKRARDIGKKGQHQYYVWHSCIDCRRQRWVLSYTKDGSKPQSLRCRFCAQRLLKATKFYQRGTYWKGGRIKTSHGYILVKLFPNNFFFPMADPKGYVFEHRLIVAQSLGRCLQRWELVHHKNHIKDDNRLENLQLVSDLGHRQITILERRIKDLENRVILLEAENIALKAREGANATRE